MAIADYKGPANHLSLIPYLIGETVKASFVDSDGRLWIIMQSGWALTAAAFSTSAPAFAPEPPDQVTKAVEKRKAEVQSKISELRLLVPGIDI